MSEGGHVLRAGPPNGPPMVLVHGLGGASVNWLPVIEPLAERGFSVSAIDLIGHGRTPRAGRKATIDSNVAFLDTYLRSTGPAVVIGNSMGGLIGMIQAAQAPETVQALVVVGPAVPRFGRGLAETVAMRAVAPALMRAGPLMRVRARRLTVEQHVTQNMRLCVRDIDAFDPDVLAAHVEVHRERSNDGEWIASFLEASSSMIRALGGRRVADTVRAICAPTLVVAGAHDRLVPLRALERIRALRPDWAMHVFEDCAHVPQLEDPEGFVDVVTAWLGGTDPVDRLDAALRELGADPEPV